MWQAVPKKWLLIGIVAASIGGLIALQWVLHAIGIEAGASAAFKAIGPLVFVLEVGVVVAFNCFWRPLWRQFPALARMVFPDVAGVWDGRFEWKVDEVTQSKPARFVISQTWVALKVTVETDEATSVTENAWIAKDADTGRYVLNYSYRHIPRQVSRDSNPPHCGTAQLVFDLAQPKAATGSYYTERRTCGDIVLRRQ